MAAQVEKLHAYEGLESEFLMDGGSITTAGVIGTDLEAMQVLGHDGTTWVIHDPGAVDGSEVAAGVLLTAVNSATAVDANILTSQGRVNGNLIKWITGISAPQIVTATAELLTLNIRVEG